MEVIKWPYDVTNRKFIPPSTTYYFYMDYVYWGSWDKLQKMNVLWKRNYDNERVE